MEKGHGLTGALLLVGALGCRPDVGCLDPSECPDGSVCATYRCARAAGPCPDGGSAACSRSLSRGAVCVGQIDGEVLCWDRFAKDLSR